LPKNINSWSISPSGSGTNSETKDVLGNKYYEKYYNISLYCSFFTATDLQRIQNINLIENVINWINSQYETGVNPQFGNDNDRICDEKADISEAVLFDENNSGQSGIYQININFILIETMIPSMI
jgi:hypothetical protein